MPVMVRFDEVSIFEELLSIISYNKTPTILETSSKVVYASWEQLTDGRPVKKITFPVDFLWKLVEENIISWKLTVIEATEECITFVVTFIWSRKELSYFGEFSPEMLVYNTLQECDVLSADTLPLLRQAYFRTPVAIVPELEIINKLGIVGPKPSSYWRIWWQLVILNEISSLFNKKRRLLTDVEKKIANIQKVQELLDYLIRLQNLHKAPIRTVYPSKCKLYALPYDLQDIEEMVQVVLARIPYEYSRLAVLIYKLEIYIRSKTRR